MGVGDVRCARKKFTFAISSPDDFLSKLSISRVTSENNRVKRRPLWTHQSCSKDGSEKERSSKSLIISPILKKQSCRFLNVANVLFKILCI